MKIEKRTYNNAKRAEGASNSKSQIMAAVGKLWTTHSLTDITLDLVAKEAGVTTRTIMRKFGSKEKLFEESLAHDAASTSSDRNQATVGDIDSILNTLLANYEAMGDAALRTIYLEPEMEIARMIGEEGRKQHREWCANMFAPFLPDQNNPQYEILLTAFIASTEIYLWKLLRKDMNKSKEETAEVFRRMLNGLVKNSP